MVLGEQSVFGNNQRKVEREVECMMERQIGSRQKSKRSLKGDSAILKAYMPKMFQRHARSYLSTDKSRKCETEITESKNAEKSYQKRKNQILKKLADKK